MPRVKQQVDRQDGEHIGIVCRKCGCPHHRVVYLKRLAGGVLLRRRECRNCGRRFSTREQAA